MRLSSKGVGKEQVALLFPKWAAWFWSAPGSGVENRVEGNT